MEKMWRIIRRLRLSSCTRAIVHRQGDREDGLSIGWDYGGGVSRAGAASGYVYTARVVGTLTTSVSAAVAN